MLDALTNAGDFFVEVQCPGVPTYDFGVRRPHNIKVNLGFAGALRFGLGPIFEVGLSLPRVLTVS